MLDTVIWRFGVLVMGVCVAACATGGTNSSDTDVSAPAQIEFTTPLYFSSSDGRDLELPPGTYRVDPGSGRQLRLTGVGSERVEAISAVEMTHEEDLRGAIALLIPEGDDLHLTLLLPGGRGWDAIGSGSGVRARGVKKMLSQSRLSGAMLSSSLRASVLTQPAMLSKLGSAAQHTYFPYSISPSLTPTRFGRCSDFWNYFGVVAGSVQPPGATFKLIDEKLVGNGIDWPTHVCASTNVVITANSATQLSQISVRSSAPLYIRSSSGSLVTMTVYHGWTPRPEQIRGTRLELSLPVAHGREDASSPIWSVPAAVANYYAALVNGMPVKFEVADRGNPEKVLGVHTCTFRVTPAGATSLTCP